MAQQTRPAQPTLAAALAAAVWTAETVSCVVTSHNTRESRGASVAAACLAATLLDGLVAVIHVTKSHGQAQAPTIARGMIEGLLDLALITTNRSTLQSLTLSTVEGRIKSGEVIMAYGKDEDSSFLSAARSRLREEKRRREALRRKGVRPLSIGDKFKKVELPLR